MFLREDPKEVIKTFLKIPASLSRHNTVFREEFAEKRNETPLVVKISDYYTDNIQQAVKHVNSLITNGSNLFLIARYAELFLDNQGVIDFEIFKNLGTENVIDVTKSELEILLAYIDMGFFTRLAAIKYLNQLIDKKSDVRKYLDPSTITYKRPPLKKRDEFLVHSKSLFLASRAKRKLLINPAGGVDPLMLIDLEAFYDVNLTLNPEDKDYASNVRKQAAIINDINKRMYNFLRILGKIPVDGTKLNSESKTRAEEMISSHIKIFAFGHKLRELIHIELERLNMRKESLLFSRPVAAVGLDHSETKVKFYLEYSKIAEFSEVTIFLPRIMSYKLGVSKDPTSQKYNKITIGPLSLATKFLEPTGITFNIKGAKQRLSTPIRLFPKLLVVSTDFLSEQSRQAEKDIAFFKIDDMVSFFKVPLKQKDLNRQFLAIDTTHTPDQPFYRVHKARTYLNSFKIQLRDESGELLSFARDTIVKINFYFRACNVDKM